MEPDLYEVLQVHPAAEPEVIDAAFRRLTRKYHPDLNDSPNATEVMRRISAAHEVLSNPDRRAGYDRQLRARRSRGEAATKGVDDDTAQSTGRRASAEVDPDAGVAISLLGDLLSISIRRKRRSR